MINETLTFIAAEINKYLSQKLGVSTDPRLVLGNLSKAMDNDTTSSDSLSSKAILSLVNIEEDSAAKLRENPVRYSTRTLYSNSPIYLNLYVVLAVNRTDYAESLKWLALIIACFQYRNVFTPQSHPALDPRIQQVALDLQSMSFEQINHLWSILGGKYMPSVLYKIRQVTFEEDVEVGRVGAINELPISGKNK